MKPRESRARVDAVRRLSIAILEADLRLEEPPALEFDAGQWVSIPFGPKTVRAYSIASTPQSRKVLTLCADVAPGGLGSAWFRALKPGDEVRFKGPLGGFVYTRADPRRPLFVAEEIGIVPIRSILTELYATGFGRPVTLVYWARDPGWLAYDAEFRSLAPPTGRAAWPRRSCAWSPTWRGSSPTSPAASRRSIASATSSSQRGWIAKP